jgi:hypothetical protein
MFTSIQLKILNREMIENTCVDECMQIIQDIRYFSNLIIL